MTDNLDKLLYGIGEEANAVVDFGGMYESLLDEIKKRQAARARRVKYMGMAAACVIVIGAAALVPGLMGNDSTDGVILEYAAAEEAPAAAEAPMAAAPMEARADEVCGLPAIDQDAIAELTEETVEEEAQEEAPAEDTVGGAGEAASGAEPDACLVNADTGTFEIGLPPEDFRAALEAKYPGIIVMPFEKSGISEGSADISVSGCENTAVWNTGFGVYYIEIGAVGSAEDFAAILRDACK